MNIKKLIEEINKLSEEDVNEVTLQDEIEPTEPAEVIEPEKPAFNDNMSLADQFDAKARIARALEALKTAVEEFKDATAEKIDLLQDEALLQGIDAIDNDVIALESALASGSQILGNTELNDPFKTDLPAEANELEEEPKAEETDEEPEEDEDDEEESDFDELAGLDLLGSEEE